MPLLAVRHLACPSDSNRLHALSRPFRLVFGSASPSSSSIDIGFRLTNAQYTTSIAAHKKEGDAQRRFAFNLQLSRIKADLQVGNEFNKEGKSTAIREIRIPRLWSWRDRVSTFEQLQYESDICGPRMKTQHQRLVHRADYKNNYDLWNELIAFRYRVYGIEGVLILWHGFRAKNIKLDNSSPSFHDVWGRFLELGFKEPDVLDQICLDVVTAQQKTGRQYIAIYALVVGYFLTNKSWDAYAWHQRLKVFPPTRKQLATLFRKARGDQAALNSLKRIYHDLPAANIHSIVIPALCSANQYLTAVDWHEFLMKKGDIPPCASFVNPMLHYLALVGRHQQLAQLMKKMEDAGVSFATGNFPVLQDEISLSRNTMNEGHSKYYDVTPKEFSDEFIARVFATTFFSVETIIKGLHMLGLSTIGPLSLREIARRSITDNNCNSSDVVQHLHLLKEMSISIGTSVLSRVIEKMAVDNQAELLHSTVVCDLHPEVFEQRNTQEALLTLYQGAGDLIQINRTVAILAMDGSKGCLEKSRWNVLLRSCLTRKDDPSLRQVIDNMIHFSISLTPRSRRYMWSCKISKRQPGQMPNDTNELHEVINIWRQFMRNGTYIPPQDWIEILRRLGMSGNLNLYERLGLWLARWYSDATFRNTQIAWTALHEKSKFEIESITVRKYLTDSNRIQPLEVLFPPAMQKAVVAWGFQHFCGDQVRKCNSDESGRELEEASCFQGLRILATLQTHGVPISNPSITGACKQRLKVLFGSGKSKKRLNLRSRELRVWTFEEYVVTMERIWGHNILLPQWPTATTLERTQMINQLKHDLIGGRPAHDQTTPCSPESVGLNLSSYETISVSSDEIYC